MRPLGQFDVCHDRYKSCRTIVEAKITTICASASLEFTWKPRSAAAASDFISDFELAARSVLDPHLPRRIFEIYVVQWQPDDEEEIHFDRSLKLLGISALYFASRWDELRRVVAPEFCRRGIYPCWKYFTEPSPALVEVPDLMPSAARSRAV